MSYCKFCIYTHPVNSKFTLWHYWNLADSVNCNFRRRIWFSLKINVGMHYDIEIGSYAEAF